MTDIMKKNTVNCYWNKIYDILAF